MKFQWEAIYETGIDKIDEQHKTFFKLVRELNDANRMDSPADISSVFEQLVDYAKHHFFTEEEILKEYSYPYFDEHKLEHIRFTQKVKELHEKFSDGHDNFLPNEVLSFLKMWLMEHIQGTDMDYVPHLKNEMNI
ncbi:MAG: hemerythrin family protein [Leptospiraceae bacterium]|nr:hemerythrin family protein [Leptospiraceae bacterium]MCP5497184.1 hemerythrin family protein [Leptospiraceae bacterium]